jgi:hypothetical protein
MLRPQQSRKEATVAHKPKTVKEEASKLICTEPVMRYLILSRKTPFLILNKYF